MGRDIDQMGKQFVVRISLLFYAGRWRQRC
jgi:hypothetical protein